ncbi:MAG: hypothetical protein ACOYKZ_03350 [Chlamydiia bacterium]
MTINASGTSSNAFSLASLAIPLQHSGAIPRGVQQDVALEDSAPERNAPETPAHKLEEKVEQVSLEFLERMRQITLFADEDGLLFDGGVPDAVGRSPTPINQASGSGALAQITQASSRPLGLLERSSSRQLKMVSRRPALCLMPLTLQQQGELATPSLQIPFLSQEDLQWLQSGRNTSVVISADREQLGQPATPPLQRPVVTHGNLQRLRNQRNKEESAEISANPEQTKKQLKAAEDLWSAYSQIPDMQEFLESLPNDQQRGHCRLVHLDKFVKLLAIIDPWRANIEQSGPPEPIVEQEINDCHVDDLSSTDPELSHSDTSPITLTQEGAAATSARLVNVGPTTSRPHTNRSCRI